MITPKTPLTHYLLISLIFVYCLLAGICSNSVSAAAAETQTSSAAAEQLRLGERMFREGVLPSGEHIKAVIKGDQTVPGTVFACASCHLRSGLGSYEESVVSPPINGPSLFKDQVLSATTSWTEKCASTS